jgi:ureidoglycolate dehydrogenase (NAD+)
MQAAIAKAKEVGVGTAIVANSQSFGAASVFALLAAKEGLIGFVTSNSGPASVAAFGGWEPAVGNHPVAWAVPLPGRSPFMIDFSCGGTSWSDVHAAGDAGALLEPGIALDETGRPTVHPRQAAALLPMAGHRGFGMSFALSALTAGLGGGKMPIRQRRTGPSEDAQHFFQAFDPAAFGDPERFAKELTRGMEQVRALKPAAGFERIRFAGDEDDARADRIRSEGVPLDDWSYNELGQRTPGGWK